MYACAGTRCKLFTQLTTRCGKGSPLSPQSAHLTARVRYSPPLYGAPLSQPSLDAVYLCFSSKTYGSKQNAKFSTMNATCGTIYGKLAATESSAVVR